MEQFYINLNIAGWGFAGVVAIALIVRTLKRRTSRVGGRNTQGVPSDH